MSNYFEADPELSEVKKIFYKFFINACISTELLYGYKFIF